MTFTDSFAEWSASLTWEAGLLVAALAAFTATFWLGAFVRPRKENLEARLFKVGVAALTTALALLVFYFLAVRLGTEYVFSYTRADYPWYYRLAGLWGGQKGTLLMWAAFTAIFGLLILKKGDRAIRDGRLSPDARATLDAFRTTAAGLLALFTIATLVAKTFEPTADYFLRFRPNGNGLQAVLITPFMIIHPPIQFVAYSLSTLIFAGGVAHLATGQRHWALLLRPWARLAWAVATLGLGLGGLWAYYVLNFGGFWAWDPVETANLIAWFPLTLLLHALLRYERGEFSAAAPFFALLTLPLTLFSTVSTRTGLWVSVHAFTDPSKNFARDPLVRLLNILETSPLLQYLAALFAASLLIALFAVLLARTRVWPAARQRITRILLVGGFAFAGLFLFLETPAAYSLVFQAAHAITLGRSAALGLLVLTIAVPAALLLTGKEETPKPTPPGRGRLDRWINNRTLLATGITLLGLSLLIVLLLDLIQVNGYIRTLYDDRAPFIAVPILLTLSTLFLLPALGARRALAASTAALALGTTLSVSLPDHWEVLLVLPGLLLAATASLLRVLSILSSGSRAPRRDRAAAVLLILGGLVALYYWGNPPTQISLGAATLRPAWGWAFPAYALAVFSVFAGALHLSRPRPTLARAGAAALVPLFGFLFAATLAGLLALTLLARSRNNSTPLAADFRERRPSLRKATVYVLHLALSLGLLGYALATYESAESPPLTADAAGSPEFQGYSIHVLSSEGVGTDAGQRLPEEIHTHINVLKDGSLVQRATLVYWLVPDNTPGHYDARVTVLRLDGEDVYLYPAAFHAADVTLTDHINGARPQAPDTVSRVELTLKILPGMHLVWSGLWLLTLSMFAQLALGAFQIGTAERLAVEPVAEASVKPTPAADAPVALSTMEK